jgi:peptide/nickel transport system ATP-binding protein
MMKGEDTDFSGVAGKTAHTEDGSGGSHPMEGSGPAACVDGLSVSCTDGAVIVDPVSFVIAPGEILGLVGESGCGKTTLALALLGFAQRGLQITAGEVVVGTKDLLMLAPRELRQVRGRVVSYVSQDPGTALNPGLRIGAELDEILHVHGVGRDRADRRRRLKQLMEEVLLPSDEAFLRRYPHQLSGGQQQRVLIAAAFSCGPRLVVLDEPTTGLDVITQEHIVRLVRGMCTRRRVAAVWVSHDLAVVSSVADRLAVMYAGTVVESGPINEVIENPAHPYTKRLLDAVPEGSGRHALIGIPGHAPSPFERTPGCAFAPRCEIAHEACSQAAPEARFVSPSHQVRCVRTELVEQLCSRPPHELPLSGPSEELKGLVAVDLYASYGARDILRGINLDLVRGTCLAVVGESGSGKTTLARCLAGLHGQYRGEVRLEGHTLPRDVQRRAASTRQAIQYVFQNPFASLNPRKTVFDIVGQPHRLFFGGTGVRAAVEETLAKVSLPAAYGKRYPRQLSGGERQRVALARALICRPRYLICDEVTSALDVSVQASIIELLRRLLEEEGVGLVFITHQLALVRSLANEVAVLADGVIVERAPTAEIFERPQNAYTKVLVETHARFDASEDGEEEALCGGRKWVEH